MHAATTGNSELDEICDKILNQIITAKMSERQKAYAVYQWIENNIKYSGSIETNDWTNDAIKAFRSRKGNCIAFYYTSKALLTRLGFDNIEVRGTEDNHRWNMVKVNGYWYHFDTTKGWGTERFLWTTKQMKDYSYYSSALNETITYEWDETAYPKTPN